MSKIKNNSAIYRTIIAFVMLPFIGFLSFLLPVLIVKGVDRNEYVLNIVAIVNYSYKNVIFFPTATLLFVFGVAVGFIVQRFCLLLGLSSILVFPCVALYEMLINPSSHNLWPIEFIIYAFFSIPAIVGAFIGKRIGGRRKSTM